MGKLIDQKIVKRVQMPHINIMPVPSSAAFFVQTLIPASIDVLGLICNNLSHNLQVNIDFSSIDIYCSDVLGGNLLSLR